MKRNAKKYYFIILISALAVVACYVFYRIKKQNFLNSELKNIVNNKTRKLYTLSYDSIYVNEASGDLFVKNIHLKGDTARQLLMIKGGDTNAARIILDIYIPLLKVVNFKTAKALLSKQLVCGQVIILNSIVNAYIFTGVYDKRNKKEQQEELYKQVLGDLKLIKADSVSIVNSKVTVLDFYSKEVKFRTFKTSVNLTDVAIDSSFNEDPTRTLFCKKIALSSDKIIAGDRRNTAEILNPAFDTKSQILTLTKFEYDDIKNHGFFKSKFEEISLHGIKWNGPVENSDLIIDKAFFKRAEVESVISDRKKEPKQKKEPKILTGWVQSFSLNYLQIKQATYIETSVNAKKKPLILKNNLFTLREVKIDRKSLFNESLVSKAKEIELINDEIILKSADNLYAYKLSGVAFNTRLKTIAIKSFSVIPQLNESAFAKKAHFQTDRFNIKILNIQCSGVNVEKLAEGEIDFKNVSTAGNSIKIFRNLSFPLDSISIRGQQLTYPHQIIHRLGFPIYIKKFTAISTDVEYKEKNPQSNSSGLVRFLHSDLTVNNISNHISNHGEKTVVNFSTYFLGEIPLTGGFTFFQDQWQKGAFTAEANIPVSFNASVLNQLTEPMSLIKIDKGVIEFVSFKINADTNTSKATLLLPYHDLKISLLQKKGSVYSKKGIISLLANLLVRNNNKQAREMRKGEILLTRNKYRSFFNFIWTSALKGITQICLLKI